MKRQLLLSLTLSMLASTAFALPATEQATPQVKDSYSVFSQTVAADGSDHTKGTLAEDGYDKTPQGQAVAEGGRDRLEQKGLVEGGSDRLQQREFVAEGGSDRLDDMHKATS